MFDRFRKQKNVHFLHIGKTGGSAVKSALKIHPNSSEGRIVLHGHDTSLSDIPNGEKVFFFLRYPISRFISGFYSRQRKGQPQYYSEWSPKEKVVFETYKTPNEIACGLADGKYDAIEAMKNVQHFKKYIYWYESFAYFQTRVEDILFIGFQETLDKDFMTLKSELGIDDSCTLPTDDIKAHRNPANLDKSIEVRGMHALKNWYQKDMKFISICKEMISNKQKCE